MNGWKRRWRDIVKESGRNYLRVEVNRSECREICSQGNMETSNSRTTTARRQRMRWRDAVERYLKVLPGRMERYCAKRMPRI
jgi:hypothetical protein